MITVHLVLVLRGGLIDQLLTNYWPITGCNETFLLKTNESLQGEKCCENIIACSL